MTSLIVVLLAHLQVSFTIFLLLARVATVNWPCFPCPKPWLTFPTAGVAVGFAMPFWAAPQLARGITKWATLTWGECYAPSVAPSRKTSTLSGATSISSMLSRARTSLSCMANLSKESEKISLLKNHVESYMLSFFNYEPKTIDLEQNICHVIH